MVENVIGDFRKGPWKKSVWYFLFILFIILSEKNVFQALPISRIGKQTFSDEEGEKRYWGRLRFFLQNTHLSR